MRKLALGLICFAIAFVPCACALNCGDEITTSVKLTADLGPCPATGLLVIGTPVTGGSLVVDLNGHKIIGSGTDIGIRLLGVWGGIITIKGPGTITGFGTGLSVVHFGSTSTGSYAYSNLLVYNIDFLNNAGGILVSQGGHTRITRNNIQGGTVGDTGMWIGEVGDVEVYRNTIQGFATAGISTGLGMPVIAQNTISGNGTGIIVHDGALIRGNMIRDNAVDGVTMSVQPFDSTPVTVEDNQIESNLVNGITVHRRLATVSDNLVRYNHANGIEVWGKDDLQVLGNQASGNGLDLYYDGSAGACGGQNILKSVNLALPICTF